MGGEAGDDRAGADESGELEPATVDLDAGGQILDCAQQRDGNECLTMHGLAHGTTIRFEGVGGIGLWAGSSSTTQAQQRRGCPPL